MTFYGDCQNSVSVLASRHFWDTMSRITYRLSAFRMFLDAMAHWEHCIDGFQPEPNVCTDIMTRRDSYQYRGLFIRTLFYALLLWYFGDSIPRITFQNPESLLKLWHNEALIKNDGGAFCQKTTHLCWDYDTLRIPYPYQTLSIRTFSHELITCKELTPR